MSTQASAEPRVLVLHNRELADVCELLDGLGASYEERTSGLDVGAHTGSWRLVVATPQRILELYAASGGSHAATVIAVCEGFSKTLAARLAQAQVDFVLRRPVHPGALRLLLMHSLYRGPEKRRFRRVSVGAPVGVRLGWRSRPAMLLELSTTGCRLLLDREALPGTRVTLALPAALCGRRPLRLRGRVVRAVGAALDDPLARHEVAAEFDTLKAPAFAILSALVHEYGRGPAPWKDAPRPEPEEATRPTPAAAIPDRRQDEHEEPDRRSSPRTRYAKPVLVKNGGPSRVLMGRDLSTGGMRVLRDSKLAVGDELEIALYGKDGIPPLTLGARVAREDGPFLMLRFESLGDSDLEALESIMTSQPLSGSDDAGEAMPMVVSEIVEQEPV